MLSPFWQEKLRWYYRWSETDIGGVRSSFMAMVNSAELRAKLVPREPTDYLSGLLTCRPERPTPDKAALDAWRERALEHAGQERPIRNALARVSRAHQAVLVMAIAVERSLMRDSFGPWGNLADASHAAAKIHAAEQVSMPLSAWLDRVSLKVQAKTATDNQKRFAREIDSDCQRIANAASEAFMEAVQ